MTLGRPPCCACGGSDGADSYLDGIRDWDCEMFEGDVGGNERPFELLESGGDLGGGGGG